MDMIHEIREYVVPIVDEIVIKPPCESDYNDFKAYSAAVGLYKQELKRHACIRACALGLDPNAYDEACDEYINMAF